MSQSLRERAGDFSILVACESSAVVREAFRRRGFNAVSCDLLVTEKPGPHVQDDVLAYLERNREQGRRFDLMIAHPPCTRLTNSGVRWLKVPPPGRTLKSMWQELESAAAFYRALQRAEGILHKAIENPIMHCYARERIPMLGQRQVVQPWWFGDEAFKATGLELINLPPLVPTNRLTPPPSGTAEHARWSKVHRASPGPDRWKERSRTYPGLADAMAEQWGNFLLGKSGS